MSAVHRPMRLSKNFDLAPFDACISNTYIFQASSFYIYNFFTQNLVFEDVFKYR